jgi:hypothetical protein
MRHELIFRLLYKIDELITRLVNKALFGLFMNLKGFRISLLFCVSLPFHSLSAQNEWLFYKHYPWVYDAKTEDWLYMRGASDGNIYVFRNSLKKWEVFSGDGQTQSVTANDTASKGQNNNFLDDKSWEEQYEEWFLNADSYGGVQVLKDIKYAKENKSDGLELYPSYGTSSSFDLSPISHLHNLKSLKIYGSDYTFSDLSPLSGLNNLTTLLIDYGNIEDISPIVNLTNLEYLSFDFSNISDLSPLRKLVNLSVLSLHDNKIEDISYLSNLNNLVSLDIGVNQISDISPLGNLGNLKWLSLTHNDITNVTPLTNLKNLETLWIWRNNFTHIDPQFFELYDSLPKATITVIGSESQKFRL